ncbi:MAG: putative ABC transporter permease [Clostridia bacterium]|nr:putative ABC transporter permease [Clostridia bacterium]
MKLTSFFNLVLMFFLFSMIGWAVECTYRSLGERRLINSGFLNGPMCPIYGTGVLVFEILLTPIREPFQTRWWLVLLVGTLGADIVEYLTSWLMEKLFHQRWWDYSHEFMNLHGRICLKHTCYWAFACMLYAYFISPLYGYLISFVPQNLRYVMLAVIFAVFICDLFLTVKATINIRRLTAKIDDLKLNISMAGEFVKIATGSLKGKAENKYSEFKETVAAVPEKFDAWRSDVSADFAELRSQFNALTADKKNAKPAERSERRLFNETQLGKGVERRLKELEEKWNEIIKKSGE